MPDAPNVRDQLYLAITRRHGSVLYTRVDARGDLIARGRRWRSCTWEVVDDVLDWLGQLDPDCDPHLLAHHLHTSRAHIAELRQALTDLVDGMEAGDMPDLQPLLDAARTLTGTAS